MIHAAGDLARAGLTVTAIAQALGFPRQAAYNAGRWASERQRLLQAELEEALADGRRERQLELEQLVCDVRQRLTRARA